MLTDMFSGKLENVLLVRLALNINTGTLNNATAKQVALLGHISVLMFLSECTALVFLCASTDPAHNHFLFKAL